MEFKVKQRREKMKLSQKELAEKANVSRTIISGLESGTIKTTTTTTLLKIADALHCKVSDLFL